MSEFSTKLPPAVGEHMAVFTPYALKRMLEIERKNTRFVHYTSAEVGLEILRTKTMWMRQACCMNDYSEVEHGLNCLTSAWHGEHGQRLQKILETRFPGIVKEITGPFDAFRNQLRYETFVTSLSEHAGPEHEDEDEYGRLSMWRAYAKGVGVALVIKQEPFWTTNTSLGLFSTPVAYLSDQEFTRQFAEVVNSIESSGAYLDKIGRDWVRHSIVMAFSAAAVSTKHPGFREEKEWRVVRTPNFPFPCPLQRVTRSVNGVPQFVLLLDLKDQPEANLVGLDPASLLDRVIIGPTAYPMPIYSSYLEQMTASGISDAKTKLRNSFLPLRS